METVGSGVFDKVASPSPWLRLGSWCAGGWRAFARAPFRIWWLCMLPLFFEAILQLLPHAGIVLSKLTVPVVACWVLLLVDAKVQRGAFAPRAGFARLRELAPAVAALAVASAAVFAVQLGVAGLIGGGGQAMALATGAMSRIDLSRTELAAVLASGMLPGLMLFFTVPRVVLGCIAFVPALRDNAGALAIHWRPVIAATAATGLAIGSVLWVPWLLLAIVPAATCIGYAAYLDVFGRVDGRA